MPFTVTQLNGSAERIRLPAQFRILTESWNRCVTVPYMVYMPEKDRLLMLVSCEYPHRAFVMTSDDHGDRWTEPRPVSVDNDGRPAGSMGTGLAYLGDGQAVCGSSGRWFSRDYGNTWGDSVAVPPTCDGRGWNTWDPPLVERDETSNVTRLTETGYAWLHPPEVERAHQQGYIRFSTDAGKTWSESIKVPQWQEVSEVALIRAGNGDLLGFCRTDIPHRLDETIDHFEGLGVAVSKDDGRTWSTVEKLYDWGRHHPSPLRLPNNDIVMTYVVREGYVEDGNGFPQFGVEAVVSHDHGRTWDLDHRYILHAWVGNRKRGPHDWWANCIGTSSVPLPDGSILTVFGTGYRSQAGVKKENDFTPRDIGLVRWRLNPEPVNTERAIGDAPFDSDLRNILDPRIGHGMHGS